MTTQGIEFINTSPEIVTSYIRNLKRRQLEVKPSELSIDFNGKLLKLKVGIEEGKEYPVRKSFLYKLLKWYSFPIGQLKRCSGYTVASICNDFLISMKRKYVILKIEEEEALTLVTSDYNEIMDLEIIEKLGDLKIKNISRNDFMMRLTTGEKFKVEPVPGDDFGVGLSIINSETGFRALSVSHYLLRFICSNGASVDIETDNNRKIHYGNKPGELQKFFIDQVKLAELKRDSLQESIIALTKKKITDANDTVNKIQRVLGKERFRLDGQLSLFEYFNMVTDSAKKYDLSKRIFLEELAGDLIKEQVYT